MPSFDHFSILNSVNAYSSVVNYFTSLLSVRESAFGFNDPFQYVPLDLDNLLMQSLPLPDNSSHLIYLMNS